MGTAKKWSRVEQIGLPVALGVVLGLGTGCSRSDEQDLVSSAEREHATELTAALEQAAFDKSVTEALEVQRRKLATVAFPVLTAQGACEQSVLEVMYDPYRNLLRFTIHQPGALDEQLRWLALGEQRIFEETKPFKQPQKLLEQGDDAKPRVALEHANEKYPELLPAGESVEIGLTAETMVAKKADESTFRYAAFEHGGWTVKLYVFSKKEAETIAAHAAKAKRAAAETYVLETLLGERAEQLRESKLDAAKRALARYDQLATAAKERQQSLEKIPFADKRDSLRVTHDPPCP